MTIKQIQEYANQYGNTVTEQEIKQFFAEHNGQPSAMDLAIFVGAMNEAGTRN